MHMQTLFASLSTNDSTIPFSAISIWVPIMISAISLIVAIAALIKSNQATYLTRNPHIKMRVEVERMPSLVFRLILENEGGRNGIIDSVDLGSHLSEGLAYDTTFDRINGKELFPGRTIATDLNPWATKKFLEKFHKEHPHKPFVVNVKVDYHDESGKMYTTPSSLNFSADLETITFLKYTDADDAKHLSTTTKGKK